MTKIGEKTMMKMRELIHMDEVDEILQSSHQKPVFVFKHSSICPISDRALGEYERFVGSYEQDDFDFTLIMIRDHRDVSNAVAEKTGVKHESPQAILLSKGQAVWDDSHYEITEGKLKQVVMMYEHGNLGD